MELRNRPAQEGVTLDSMFREEVGGDTKKLMKSKRLKHYRNRFDSAVGMKLSHEALLVHIRAIYAEARVAYGWPRISTPARTNRLPGTPVMAAAACARRSWGRRRVERLMQAEGMRARGRRRFKITTTNSGHNLPIAPNVLDRNFNQAAPDQGLGWRFHIHRN